MALWPPMAACKLDDIELCVRELFSALILITTVVERTSVCRRRLPVTRSG